MEDILVCDDGIHSLLTQGPHVYTDMYRKSSYIHSYI